MIRFDVKRCNTAGVGATIGVVEAERMLTVREVARKLQVTEESVRRWLRGGLLRGVPLRGRAGWRVPESELRRFLEERLKSGRPTD
jgi:excisionase family DNA binding protein